jgi:creatinine amidohydrolase
MRMEDLNWMDVENYLKQDDRIILIIGACEQHGYLSLLTDIRIPQALADAASQQNGVLIAPPLNFGVSPYFLRYPGTISLRVSTFIDVLEDMVRSLHGYGFRRMLVLNGHGGNHAGNSKLTELANDLPGLKLAWYEWWDATSVTAVAMKHGLRSYHAAWIEAFPFTRVAELPQGEKKPAEFSGMVNAEEARLVYGDGVFGGPYQASDAVMNEVFAAALKDILFELEFQEI